MEAHKKMFYMTHKRLSYVPEWAFGGYLLVISGILSLRDYLSLSLVFTLQLDNYSVSYP
jgi:hypothetical protein